MEEARRSRWKRTGGWDGNNLSKRVKSHLSPGYDRGNAGNDREGILCARNRSRIATTGHSGNVPVARGEARHGN